ncbi:LLM class flavin-dependent oxidoreductase [Novosphingobium sp. BL-52-GroH]|uniref:LLM class flavin-dependent oxidoreductase n=1 Tax=Novosphingobium sp. BL-52-GroH TaxID=3349877 RepID=UPI00384E5D1E
MSDDFDLFRASGHKLFSDRKLKLGTFCSNSDGGFIVSKVEGQIAASWPSTLDAAKLADAAGFEAIVPLGRWYGRHTLESYTWAAALAAVTENPLLFSTSHVASLHPVVAAKQGATIDQISGGRFALNIVCGWMQSEIDLFGASAAGTHVDRYAQAAEWVTIIKRLWTSPDPFDFTGEYYQVKGAALNLNVTARPRPPIMNAGVSEVGKRFAVAHCDMVFIAPKGINEEIAAQVADYRRLAREEFGREIQVWTYASVIDGETEQDADDFYHYFVEEKGDWAQAEHHARVRNVTSPPMPPEEYRRYLEKLIAGDTGCTLMGGPDQIAEGLARLSSYGLDGVLLAWPQYHVGLERFQRLVLPRIERIGLR